MRPAALSAPAPSRRRAVAEEPCHHPGPAREFGPACQEPAPGRPGPAHRSRSLLLEILLSARGPLCCHDVRRLLGPASRPLALPALRARVHRLTPRLARRVLRCRRGVHWGADAFTLHALDGDPEARPPQGRPLR